MSERSFRAFREHSLGLREWVFVAVILAGFGFSLMLSSGNILLAFFGPWLVSPAVYLGIKLGSMFEAGL